MDDATLAFLATAMRTHYDNLKVLETASRDDIKASYRKLCLKYHPDRNPGNAEAERIMRIINDAYDVLSDPVKRRGYDQDLFLRRARETPSRNASSSKSRREVWPSSQQTRPRYTRKPGSPYQGPVRPAGGWYRQWETGHDRSKPDEGGIDQLAMRVLICVAVVAFANIFFKGGSPLHFGSTSTTTGRNFLDSRPALQKSRPTVSASSPSSSLLPVAPEAQQSLASPKPATAPNGSPWPENAGYVKGYPLAALSGGSRMTLDNSGNDDNVFAKLMATKGDAQVRTFYVPAHGTFTLTSLAPGEYHLRFQNLATSRMYETRAFSMKETATGLGIDYTTLSLRVTRSGCESLDATEVTEKDF